MPGKWEVTKTRLNGKPCYIVRRKLDPAKPYGSGNEEMRGVFTPDRKAAQAYADYLNEKGE